MKPSLYDRADTVSVRCAWRGAHSQVIAGGTNLLDLMKLQIETRPCSSISAVFPSPRSKRPRKAACVSARGCEQRVAADLRVRQRYPVLVEASAGRRERAASQQGHDRRQSAAAARLLFLRLTKPCNKRVPAPAAQPSAVSTEFTPSSERARIVSPHTHPIWRLPCGARRAGRDHRSQGPNPGHSDRRLHRPPGRQAADRDSVEGGRDLTSVTLPPPPPGRQLYRKVRDRASFAFALVSVAVVVECGRPGNSRRARRIRRLLLQALASVAGRGETGRRICKCEHLQRRCNDRAGRSHSLWEQ